MKPLIYIAGPMTADPYGCVREAIAVGLAFSEEGCVPYLPQLSALHDMISPRSYEDWLGHDLAMIDHCNGLVRLPGDSPGADREVAHAHKRGLGILHFSEQMMALARDHSELSRGTIDWIDSLITTPKAGAKC